MTRLIAALVLVGISIVPLAQAQGTIQITFDGPPFISPGTAIAVTNYEESDMSFSPIPGSPRFGRVGPGGSSDPQDGTAFLKAALGYSLRFSFINGSLFSLVSIDLAEYSTVAPDPVTVQFIGYYSDGSTVTTSFTTDGIIDGTGPLADFQTFYFNQKDWSDLTRVEIPTSGWSLDNLVVSVPEPGAGAISLVGGVAFWVFARRRRRTKDQDTNFTN